MILILTINHSTHDTIIDSATNSYTWQGNTYTESGEYVFQGLTESGCDSIIILHLTINKLGIEDVDPSETITIFPNPTRGLVTISPSEVSLVEVFDATGRSVATFYNTNEIDIKHLPNGVYTIRITLTNNTAVKHIIKQ